MDVYLQYNQLNTTTGANDMKKIEIELDDDGYLWIWFASINDTMIGDERSYDTKEDAIAFMVDYDKTTYQRDLSDADKESRTNQIREALESKKGFYEDKENEVSYYLNNVSLQFRNK